MGYILEITSHKKVHFAVCSSFVVCNKTFLFDWIILKSDQGVVLMCASLHGVQVKSLRNHCLRHVDSQAEFRRHKLVRILMFLKMKIEVIT